MTWNVVIGFFLMCVYITNLHPTVPSTCLCFLILWNLSYELRRAYCSVMLTSNASFLFCILSPATIPPVQLFYSSFTKKNYSPSTTTESARSKLLTWLYSYLWIVVMLLQEKKQCKDLSVWTQAHTQMSCIYDLHLPHCWCWQQYTYVDGYVLCT